MYIWEHDQISVKIDKKDRRTTLETNSSGLMASYVTIHLEETELDELIEALHKAKSELK